MNLADWGDGQTIDFTFYLPKDPRQVVRPTVEISITRIASRLWLKFGYSKKLTEMIKECFDGYKWHGFEEPPIKQWSVKHCAHNWFQILFLAGRNPYATFDGPLLDFKPVTEDRPPMYDHQHPMTAHVLTRHYAIIAGEMGIGKTRAILEAMEVSGKKNWLYVAPRSALTSVELEFEKWRSKIMPTFITYHGLEKHNAEWTPGRPVYDGVVFDEVSRIKNPVAKRTLAAQWIADAVRREHGMDGYVVGMSGTPAPKSPADWYAICETICPGFLKEGNIHVFKNRLSIIRMMDNGIGMNYPKLIAWRDDERRCDVCGKFENDEIHDLEFSTPEGGASDFHPFKKSVNEVARLYKRMDGLVLVKFKKDCLSLPEKRYVEIRLKPTRTMMRAAQLVVDTASSTVKALTYLRQLSDGFRYTEVACGTETCTTCNGTRTTMEAVYKGPERTWSFLSSIGGIPEWIDPADTDAQPEDIPLDPSAFPQLFDFERVACALCAGSGEITKYEREAEMVECPKDDALKNILEDHEDVGRLVVYGGFTGTVDRVTEICQKEGWHFIRVDGRGWFSDLPGDAKTLLKLFQDRSNEDRIVFVGQPGAAGMGLTLTASPSIVYYSNDFNGESRIQSEDRIHRAGMDATRGATIYDLFHLPSDEYILNNLRAKRRLQELSLGEVKSSLEFENVGQDNRCEDI